MSIAIACASGSFRVAFVHGVLTAFESAHFQAEAYAGASSSAIPTAYAVLGQLKKLGRADYWKAGLSYYEEHNHDASQLVIQGIKIHGPVLRGGLFGNELPRFLIATSAVVTSEAAQQTQGDGARRLGQELLAGRKDRTWANQHLALHLFGTLDSEEVLSLTPDNLDETIYASTRMLHAWKIPATIDGRPYIDASYTCSCPAIELTKLGFDEVIAIVPEPGIVYRDIFKSEPIPKSWHNSPIHLIQPDISLRELAVDYMNATPDGLEATFRSGEEKGHEFLERFMG